MKQFLYSGKKQKTAFEELKRFLKLHCQSVEGQLNNSISLETELHDEADLITADFPLMKWE